LIVSDDVLGILKWVWLLVGAGFAIALRVMPRGDKRAIVFGVVALVCLGLAFG